MIKELGYFLGAGFWGRGEYFSEFPFFCSGEKFPSHGWFGEEFPICYCIHLLDSGDNSLKVVRIKLVSHAYLPWANALLSLFKFENFWKQ
jgi:hypothetical protein